MSKNNETLVAISGQHVATTQFLIVRAVFKKFGLPADILHLDAYPDIFNAFEEIRGRCEGRVHLDIIQPGA
ncbi:hypothetical protein Pyn_14593 [Prunus yedoensis var. nudiflora]|uniref:Uncharacterized protein n=1 Tax=Prunus yedoensis var. nudiflora TaxID=2094558 RepID=A0A314XLE1_PRUYE|nr:hypothetical protein Pyn_14593 [Prunus yedoensis var. nudiflora]